MREAPWTEVAAATAFPHSCNVESQKSGISDTSQHPQVWYRRRFFIPEAWEDNRILLNFGAVDYRSTVWVNGRVVGEHEGGNTPFRFEITSHLRFCASLMVGHAAASGPSACCCCGVSSAHRGLVAVRAAREALAVEGARTAVEAALAGPAPIALTPCVGPCAWLVAAASTEISQKATPTSEAPVRTGSGLATGVFGETRMELGVIACRPT